MAEDVETVEIVSRKGTGDKNIINATDFAPATDVLWADKDTAPARSRPTAQAAPPAATPAHPKRAGQSEA